MKEALRIATLGEPILKKEARVLDVPRELSFAKNLSEKMFSLLGSLNERIGLAAPQVFESVRLFVYRIPNSTHPRYKTVSAAVPPTIMINPVWTPLSAEKAEGWEGCISVPGMVGIVQKHTNILCTYTDLSGEETELHAEGFHARVIQHEIDHLDGVTFIERMTDLSSFGFEDVILKQRQVDMDEVA
jgi:peptide deformylase